MKRLIIGLISLVVMLVAGNALADMAEKTVPVKLVVYQVIELDVSTPAPVIVEPEDYDPRCLSKQSFPWCTTPPLPEYGFAIRHDAIYVKMFTNARKGATLYFAGKSNPDHDKSLHVEDVYLTVMKEKTYVLASSPIPCTGGGIDAAFADAHTIPETSEATWIQCHQEAKRLCGVKQRTEATRLWVLNLGIGSIAEYTENLDGYEMDLTFILMPMVV